MVASLTGVGVGSGDPELITLKALHEIQAADVVFVPVRRGGESSYALRVAEDLIDRDRQRVIPVPFPETGEDQWSERCRTIAAALDGEDRGIFLTEGDPTLYSSFGHVGRAMKQLRPEIRLDVVPGVSSVTAAAATAGLTLADHAERVAILPAMHALSQLEETLRSFECVVLIKVGPVLLETIELLERLDLLEQAVYVRRCGQPDEQVVRDLRSLVANPSRDYFALIVVRKASL